MRKLSEVARYVAVPEGVTATGWPAVVARSADLGVTYRDWQHGIGRVLLAKREDGLYAATVGGVCLSIPRQSGKTFLICGTVFSLCMMSPGLTVVWTAHRLRTAEETFGKMRAFAARKKVAPHVVKVLLGSGEETILFRNGSRILFGARAAGFGRGFDEVDVVIFDEAQHLTESALDDIVPAMNQSRQPTGGLLVFMGTPPQPGDKGDSFRRMRREAVSGEDREVAWVEFGADPDYLPPETPAPLTARDWAQIEKANPSYPQDTPKVSVLRMRKQLSPQSFVREGLGVWDEDRPPGLFPDWPSLGRPEVGMPERVVLGVAGTRDGLYASLAVAGLDEAGDLVVGAVERRSGQQWVVEEIERIQGERGCDVVLDRRGPLSHLLPALDDAGVRYEGLEVSAYVDACQAFWQAVSDGRLTHPGHRELDKAVEVAQWRQVGDRRAFSRQRGDVSMLEAAALAAHLAVRPEPDLVHVW